MEQLIEKLFVFSTVIFPITDVTETFSRGILFVLSINNFF